MGGTADGRRPIGRATGRLTALAGAALLGAALLSGPAALPWGSTGLAAQSAGEERSADRAREAARGPAGLPEDRRPANGSGRAAAGTALIPDPGALEAALEVAASLGPLSSLLVQRRGELVVERYWRGMRPDRPVNVKSVSKTLLHPLVGAAIRDGHLEGVDQPVAELLPEYFRDGMDPRKRRITLGHLLSMSAGLQSTSFGNYGAWVSSRDWVRDALERPMTCTPGGCWRYSTGNTHLLSAILTRATGKSTLAYAREVLFEPLGIQTRAWDRDPQGRYLGGNNMSLTPREMLRFGELYLNFGRWNGRQVVPPEWIVASWQPRHRSPYNDFGYGYLWWTDVWAGERAWFGWGYGGQYVVVVPDLELVVVVTSDLSARRRGHIRDVRRLLRDHLVPAFAS